MGLPWAVVLEGHAWWHLMTGIGGESRSVHEFHGCCVVVAEAYAYCTIRSQMTNFMPQRTTILPGGYGYTAAWTVKKTSSN